MKKSGLPTNVNPFSIINDYCLCDGLVAGEFPNYFRDDAFVKAPTGCFCRARSIKHIKFTQTEAELLVRMIVKTDPICAVGVKEAYQHIIPPDLCNEVPIVRTRKGQCRSNDVVNKEIWVHLS